MKTKLALFGCKFDVTSRLRRRWLVAVTYMILGVLLAACWILDRSGIEATLATLFLGYLAEAVFGGNMIDENPFLRTHGVIAPFNGNEFIQWSNKKSPALVRFLYPKPLDVREIHNDERDIRTRDAAHYRAFGIMSGVVFLISAIKVFHAPDWLVFAVLQIGLVFIFTLPQAILLWTEPDMEEA